MTTESSTDGPPATRSSEAVGPPVRVGRIDFVNCFPLYHHFERELAARGVSATVVNGFPSDLNRMLVEGRIDVALPSSIAFARDAEELVLLPHVSISSFGAVDSIQLFSRVPSHEVTRVALTEKSATSVCLLRILCHEWGIAPEFVAWEGTFAEVLAACDGMLLIGDDALRALRAGVFPYHLDLGEAWHDATGLHMVYAVCAARRDFVAARPAAAAVVGASLLASRDDCAAQPQATAAAAAQLYDFSALFLERYFDRLKFGFAPEYRAGLREFYRRAVEVGELDDVPDLGAVAELDDAPDLNAVAALDDASDLAVAPDLDGTARPPAPGSARAGGAA
ncbi:MAG TPA: menaquinone biosynthesis protein [Thermoleophilia bacterium]|nr:menaquinone biosynthesis protein [Thermoleophilia bacterium]